MKFYLVRYHDESQPESHGGEYFKTKREAVARKRVLDSEDRHVEPCKQCGKLTTPKGTRGITGYCEECEIYTDSGVPWDAEIDVIELTGTCREMCWQALHEQIVP